MNTDSYSDKGHKPGSPDRPSAPPRLWENLPCKATNPDEWSKYVADYRAEHQNSS